MWIASKLGFFSIVQKDGCWHVRARLKKDLVNLIKRCTCTLPKIEEWPDADYRWRIRVNALDLATVFDALENSIDYQNFKSEVSAIPDQADKVAAYCDLWSSLARLQRQDRCKTSEGSVQTL